MRLSSLCLAVAFATCAASASAPAFAAPGSGRSVVVDGFENLAPWSANPADGVALAIASDAGAAGRAMRLDFDFHGGGGYAVAHRKVALDLAGNWRFTFRLRGACRPNNLEFKLIDASGDNVWWVNRRDVEFSKDWTTVTIKKRHVSFAWGPKGGGEPAHVAALEFAVTAGQGGRGSVWIDDLRLERLPDPPATWPAPLARATSGAESASLALDADDATAWSPSPGDREPAWTLDFGARREFGGLKLVWGPGRHAADYTVECSDDGRRWVESCSVRGANGGTDWVWAPESEARFVRVRIGRAVSAAGVVLASVEPQPLEWSASRNAFFAAIAKGAPRGAYPRATGGENIFWTVVGPDHDSHEGLLDEYGRLEPSRGEYAVEPFLRTRGRLVTWADVRVEQSLADGYLPVPSVEWAHEDLRLRVTVAPIGAPGHAALLARWRVTNLGSQPRRDTLFLAVRPFQVNPPSQFLNTPGGFTPVREVAIDDRLVRVNGTRGFASLTAPYGGGAVAFAQGDVVDFLRDGELPRPVRMTDRDGLVSAALGYALELPANGAAEVVAVFPLHEPPAYPSLPPDSAKIASYADQLQRASEQAWRTRQDRVTLQLPDVDVLHALKAQLAYVLVNRNGPAIQPGTRAYARSWIRDGSLTASALLRLGETEAVRDFIRWFAPYQYANGKAPCCVDSRGADPVPEHDSSGELIYLVTEYYRYTHDRAFADSLWTRVVAAAGYLDTLRAQRRTEAWRGEAGGGYFGLLPPSISHEGYSAKPMHSYWDDFWALRGYKDAAFLAAELGKPERAALERSRDEFAGDLAASIPATMRTHGIDYVPGCADLGDFDPTSTSIGLTPGDAEALLPAGALVRTYERYWDFFVKRRDGVEPWDAYTPYEWRNVGAMVRLGWRDRAQEATRWFLGNRRPKGFQHWAEVVTHDERAPRFLGDMPHTWCGTDYVRSVLDMLAYEREADSALVIGAGVTEAWLDAGVVVRDLRTRWGGVSFTLRRQPGPGGSPRMFATIESRDMTVPKGGIVLDLPAAWARTLQVDGERRAATDGRVTLHSLPADVSWWPDPPTTAPSKPREPKPGGRTPR